MANTKTKKKAEPAKKAKAPLLKTQEKKVAKKSAQVALEPAKTKVPRRARLQHSTHMSSAQALTMRQWLHIDAKNQVLGRISTLAASILRGKHKPEYSPHVDVGDYVVITNAKDIKLTGNKATGKIYYHHTGYTGNMKERTAGFIKSKNPRELIRLAIKGMLPHNTLGNHMLKKLRVFTGEKHTHEGQHPKTISLSPNMKA